MEMTTLEELERLLKAGTQGELRSHPVPAYVIEADGTLLIGEPTGEHKITCEWRDDHERRCTAMYATAHVTAGHEAETEANAALIVAAINALPELLDRVERLEADMQVIAFGSRIVANADNTLSHVDWTREQLVEFARAALAKDATT